nr:serine/arginine repetitive matrix protein 1-like [Aegilops tauschii subsp. strangulata]
MTAAGAAPPVTRFSDLYLIGLRHPPPPSTPRASTPTPARPAGYFTDPSASRDRQPSRPSSTRRPARRPAPAVTALLRPGHLLRLHPAASRHAAANHSRRSRVGPPIDPRHPPPPLLHGGPAVYLAGLVLGCVGTAASGSSAASTQAPLLRWSLGPRYPGAGAALAVRVPVLTSSPARRPTPSVVTGLISDSAATSPPPSAVPDLALDRLDHPLAAAIHLIYAARPTWPVGYARLRRSREDRPRV